MIKLYPLELQLQEPQQLQEQLLYRQISLLGYVR
jgi:hypothetical protein